ncbi:MAG: 50S ribosomal protein L23 [Planctomycetes bacterium]|nr:50S ribosomal protein L23 [Planctomycetota bacterium]
MENPYKIIKKPLITEKGTFLTELSNSYNFLVDINANKNEIRKAVESLFKVRVMTVNTMIRKGKRKGMAWRQYQRASLKRAVVTLKEGDAIEFI